MTLLNDAFQIILNKSDVFYQAVKIHLLLSCIALAIAIVISVPLGVYLSKRNKIAAVILNVFYLGKIIPSLAILALAMPLIGIGFAPSLLALAILAIPSILINTVIAFKEVDKNVIEAAKGMGMDKFRIMRKVEFPLALPVVITGIRTAIVEVIAGATLAAFIGGGGLGDFIINGIALAQPSMLLVGALPICILAFAGDMIFGGIEKWVSPKTGQ
jgi:osmoprotectant transport system permease protein